ncbi:MAG: DUF3192 domain-containing protein [Candidatus Omnitrophica bacterium]|nr:DUF3192 domain-containing protein [Candidatus Omnitrophota bacterium]
MRKIACILTTFLLLSGCVAPFMGYRSDKSVARINRKRLSLIVKGMTKKEALKVMGEETFYYCFDGFDIIDNPAFEETIIYGNEEEIEVIYYFTQVGNFYYSAQLEECTPLVFKDDILLGWGRGFLEKLIGKNGYTKKKRQ